jgi:hypothetical protein
MEAAARAAAVPHADGEGILSKSNPAKARRLYMIGNAHIDPVWAWRWHEGVNEVLETCRSWRRAVRRWS